MDGITMSPPSTMSIVTSLEPLLLRVPISLEVALRTAIESLGARAIASETRAAVAEAKADAAEAKLVTTENRAISAEVAIGHAWTSLGAWAAAQGPREATGGAVTGATQVRMEARAVAAEAALGATWVQLAEWAMVQPNIPGAWASDDPTIVAFRTANSAEDLNEILAANLYHVGDVPVGFRLGGDSAGATTSTTSATPVAGVLTSAPVATANSGGGGNTSRTEAGGPAHKSRRVD
jgi:hypothetical protein